MNAQKFTQKSLEAIQEANNLALSNNNMQIEQEHLLYALLTIDQSLIAQLIKKMGKDPQALTQAVKQEIDKMPGVTGSGREAGKIYVAQDVDTVLAKAENIADSMKDEYVSVEHLMLSLMENPNRNLKEIFKLFDIRKNDFLKVLQEVRGNTRVTSDSPEGTYDVLKKYGHDLVEDAREKKLDPVIGRDSEIRDVMMILSRKTKNNPVLIGEPGVGKTAIAEGLAQRIAQGRVPKSLQGKRLIALDLVSMVAGTKYRGEFEERVKNMMDEAAAAQDIILFIDEIHNIIGAGAAEGSIDAANILKPQLSRGEIQLMGATTVAEYRRYIEKDSALERRFQSVLVEEPSDEESVQILRGILPRYEQHHGVKITEEAVQAAVRLSRRYLPDRFLPDKAIDLMDEAASRVQMEEEEPSEELMGLEEKLNALAADKEAAIAAQDFEKAAQLRDTEKDYQKQLEAERDKRRKSSQEHRDVTEEDIAAVVSDWTGVPVTRLTEDEGQRLLHMEDTLHKRVVGQDEAVEAVARAIRRGRVGLKDPKRPIGSFLFLGPTGVGKTELCKSLAEAMFGDESAMIRIDMSEYMERHTGPSP